jgi:hypothetical protein
VGVDVADGISRDGTPELARIPIRSGLGGRADRLFEAYCAAQQRLLGVFFGDSVLFVRASALEAVGRFSDAPVFEDLDVVLRRAGPVASCGCRSRCAPRTQVPGTGRAHGRYVGVPLREPRARTLRS